MDFETTATTTAARGRRRTRRPRVGLVAAVPLAGGSAALPRVPLVLYNRTPSMATGLYVRVGQVAKRGDVIAFHLPRPAWGYARGRGERTDLVLLKHVLAVGGDHVSTRGGRLVVNGVDVGPIPVVDSAGRSLPQWRAGRVCWRRTKCSRVRRRPAASTGGSSARSGGRMCRASTGR